MGCASQFATESSPPAATESSQLAATEKQTYEYRIGPEDRLAIDVWQNEDVSRTVVVRPDGMISLPLLNDVRAVGLTPEELREVLATQLEEFIPNIELSVSVLEISSMKISVLGEVNTPGRYALWDQTTVLEAIAMAGGLKAFANRRRVIINRQEGQTKTQLVVNLDKVEQANGGDADVTLKRGDVIIVPSRNF